MIKTIVVATDASKHGNKAVELASELAGSLKARLVIVHALLFEASGTSLRKLANRRELTRDQRHLLDTYEIDTQLTVAAAGGMDTALAYVPPPVEVLEPIGRQILVRAAQTAREIGAKDVTTKLLSGAAADSILVAAKKEKANLIVMGTRGFGNLKGFFLGSVSHKVNARAHCPVMTVK